MKFRMLFISFLVAGGGALCAGVQQSLRIAEEMARSSLKVAVFLSPALTDAEGEQWVKTLPNIDPAIESAEYISRDEALKRAQQNPMLGRSLLLLRKNPFPASVVIRYQGPAWFERSDPAIKLRDQPSVQEIRWDAELRSHFRSLWQWHLWLGRVGLTVFMMLVAGALVGFIRFLKTHRSWSELWIQGGVGLLGGGLAIGLWGIALQKVGTEAAAYRPTHLNFWPLLAGVLASMVMSDE
jgi:cell division protein FtsX